MNTLKLNNLHVSLRNVRKGWPIYGLRLGNYLPYLFLVGLALLWPVLQDLLRGTDPTIGFIDPNIWLLVLLGLICFLVVTGLSWWLLQKFWMSLGLPDLGEMVVQFKNMESWKQLGFFWLCFASLLWAGVMCLGAIC
uniref:hypothetical protein n=1 Tax=Pedobacter schmidteae TaxID=2201271 RepID=UPI000EABED9A|nr:hypothetical protein [Pedobacter schmidteae]